MKELTEEIEDKLNLVGVNLSELLKLIRIMQVCFDYEENLEINDNKIIFGMIKSIAAETKNNFNEIQKGLEI